ncbi:MAG: acyl-CoA thioesterase [Oscillatoriaceae cyanobacterium]
MSPEKDSSTQLPPTPEAPRLPHNSDGGWFEYPIRVHPHHTDYGGIVWHGTYLTWLEEARVESLRSLGVNFADLVAIGCDLPVVELSLRYHKGMRMGMDGVVKARMLELDGVRLKWEYRIESPDGKDLYLSGLVTLVAVDSARGKIFRSLPPGVKDALSKQWS